jgi:hypothetical protein
MADLKPVLPLIPAQPPHKGTPRQRRPRGRDDAPTERRDEHEQEGSAESGAATSNHILDEYA